MGTRRRIAAWRHVAVAVGYALAVLLFRAVIVPHWLIVCGLHLSVLLLVPYRYWPALIAGESMVCLKISIECEPQFGLLWALFNLVPSLVFAAPFVYWSRERWPVLRRSNINVGDLLVCTLLVSAAMTVNSIALLWLMQLPKGYVVHWGEVSAGWVLGNYLGALTIVPIMLAIHQTLIRKPMRAWVTELADSKLVIEAVGLLFPAMAILVWLALSTPSHTNTRQIAQIAAFIPVVWIAMRHGWKGAAIGGMAASIAIIVLMPEKFDHRTVQAETLCAFVISTMLLVGGRVTEMNRQAEQERLDVQKALELAQRNALASEHHLKTAAAGLEQAREQVERGFAMMLGRLRVLQPAIAEAGYQRHALTTQEHIGKLADALYPTAWRDRGLPAALQEGVVAKALQESGFRYTCDFRGPLASLPQPVRIALYRAIIEAIADVCAKRNTAELLMRVRCGVRHGRQWVLTTLTFRGHPVAVRHVEWDQLLPVLRRSSSGLGWQAVQDRARTFEGHARERVIVDARRISILLQAPESSTMTGAIAEQA